MCIKYQPGSQGLFLNEVETGEYASANKTERAILSHNMTAICGLQLRGVQHFAVAKMA
jgi:hypothetical protein